MTGIMKIYENALAEGLRAAIGPFGFTGSSGLRAKTYGSGPTCAEGLENRGLCALNPVGSGGRNSDLRAVRGSECPQKVAYNPALAA